MIRIGNRVLDATYNTYAAKSSIGKTELGEFIKKDLEYYAAGNTPGYVGGFGCFNPYWNYYLDGMWFAFLFLESDKVYRLKDELNLRLNPIGINICIEDKFDRDNGCTSAIFSVEFDSDYPSTVKKKIIYLIHHMFRMISYREAWREYFREVKNNESVIEYICELSNHGVDTVRQLSNNTIHESDIRFSKDILLGLFDSSDVVKQTEQIELLKTALISKEEIVDKIKSLQNDIKLFIGKIITEKNDAYSSFTGIKFITGVKLYFSGYRINLEELDASQITNATYAHLSRQIVNDHVMLCLEYVYAEITNGFFIAPTEIILKWAEKKDVSFKNIKSVAYIKSVGAVDFTKDNLNKSRVGLLFREPTTEELNTFINTKNTSARNRIAFMRKLLTIGASSKEDLHEL